MENIDESADFIVTFPLEKIDAKSTGSFDGAEYDLYSAMQVGGDLALSMFSLGEIINKKATNSWSSSWQVKLVLKQETLYFYDPFSLELEVPLCVFEKQAA